MKHSILITTGMIAGLLFVSSGAIAAPHGDKQKIYPQKHSVSKSVHNKAGKGHRMNIRGVNVARLEQSIQRGTRQGKLTRPEIRVVTQGLNSLKATIKAVKRDRRVTNWEEKRVQQKSAQLSRTIKRLVNNHAVVKRGNKHYSRKSHR